MPNQALEFLRHLVSITELQLESAKEDFLSAAVSKPIHGMKYFKINFENFKTLLNVH